MEEKIIIKGARVHNLKNISLALPKNKLIVFTGVSGSGKSSLAFDTIFAEGQRRYIESLSPYARQFLGQMDRPDVDEIIGLSPAIAIDQRALSHNPRSTVGTLTEIYDYLRVLYARLGEVHCPLCDSRIKKLSLEEMIDIIAGARGTTRKMTQKDAEKLPRTSVLSPRDSAMVATILSPVVRGRKGEYYQLLYDFLNLGFSEARVDGKIHSLHEKIVLSRYKNHNIDIVMDRVMLNDESRLFEAVENALNYSRGLVTVVYDDDTRIDAGENIGTSDVPNINIDVDVRTSEVKKLKSGIPRTSTSSPREPAARELLLSSRWTCSKDNFAFPEVEPRLFSFNSPYGACPTCHGLGKTDLFLNIICPDCQGKRLKLEALAVRIHNKNIDEVVALTIDKAHNFFADYEKKLSKEQKTIASNVLKEINDRLKFMLEVGLDYLSLNREAETLSGGEAQRIRLASQIGSQLSGALYVLDEPTIGLHERDTERLIQTLKSLKNQSNTVIVVEHDEKTIEDSDFLVDLGPLAGKRGGEVVAIGETKNLLKPYLRRPTSLGDKKTSDAQKLKDSLTLQYLRGDKKIKVPNRRSKISEKLSIIGARVNNLKNINVEIPLRKLVCLTGVSGSGKSSLLYEALYQNLVKIKVYLNEPLDKVAKILGAEYLDKVVVVDQSPIGRTPRSNPATYTGIFTPIREFYASLEDSRAKGYTASRFSFNVAGRSDKSGQVSPQAGGRCEACQGAGFKLIEMHFLPPVLVQCEICHGKRFNRETLQVKHKNKNISDVLAMAVDDAVEFFDGIYTITDKLKVLQEVGLGYLQLGQSATTLSGGEAQRIKLARELTHPLGKRTLYLLDEPTVGLHYHDIEMLLKVLNKLVDKGNTVVVIEHNMHIIKSCDYVIDLGPEGGEKGGKIIAKGTPEEVSQNKHSYTGKHLKRYLA